MHTTTTMYIYKLLRRLLVSSIFRLWWTFLYFFLSGSSRSMFYRTISGELVVEKFRHVRWICILHACIRIHIYVHWNINTHIHIHIHIYIYIYVYIYTYIHVRVYLPFSLQTTFISTALYHILSSPFRIGTSYRSRILTSNACFYFAFDF